MSKRITLSDLVEKIDWVVFDGGRGLYRLRPNELAIGFFPRNRKSTTIDDVRVRMGKDVVTALGWRPGDRIRVHHHPDDLMSFMLIRNELRDDTDGVTLMQEPGSPHCMFRFRWNRGIPLDARKSRPVPYIHVKSGNYLVFRVGSDDETVETAA